MSAAQCEDRSFPFWYANFYTDLSLLKHFLENMGVAPLIIIEHRNFNDQTIKYKVVSDEGKFVNFGGFYINTASGYVCLGYNANNGEYIPIFNLVDVFNSNSILGDKNILGDVFTLDDLLYIIERFKINYREFQVRDYLYDVFLTRDDKIFRSISLNYIKDNLGKRIKYSNLAYLEEIDLFNFLSGLFSVVSKEIDHLGKVFFGNFILEDDRSIVGKTQPLESPLDGGHMERYFVRGVTQGYDSVFLRELSSVALGRNRRLLGKTRGESSAGLYDVYTGDTKKGIAVASSWAYFDQYDITTVSSISEDKIRSYNIVDLLRSIGREADLFFTLDVYKDNPKFFEVLMNKLGLLSVVDSIGRDKFIKRAFDYKKLLSIIEMGGTYSRKVKLPQTSFMSVGTRSVLSSGKVFEKAGKRLLRRFNT